MWGPISLPHIPGDASICYIPTARSKPSIYSIVSYLAQIQKKISNMVFEDMKDKITPPVCPIHRPTCLTSCPVLLNFIDVSGNRYSPSKLLTNIKNPSRETSPNRGSSVHQSMAIPKPCKPLRQWQQEQSIDRDAQIKLTKLVHMRYQHPDLNEIGTFLGDFGMSVAKQVDGKTWFKGYSDDQYVYYAQQGPKKFLGGSFEVASYDELEKAARVPGATGIQELSDAPGGGYMVTLYDPEGFPINLVHGQAKKEAGPFPETLIINYEKCKPRIARFQRFKPGPAAVHKLGHYGLCVENFQQQAYWYTRTFNIVPTDFLYVNTGGPGHGPDVQRKEVAMFAHIDLGPAYTDHHTIFLSQNKSAHVHHSSFEVHDFDTQKLGHEWLAKKGYGSVWGVGRHILGSQLFDYWWDTTGFMIEHYADGDLVNEETEVGWGLAGDESLAVWGPEVPKWFLEGEKPAGVGEKMALL